MKKHNWNDLRYFLVIVLVLHIHSLGVLVHEFGHAVAIFLTLGAWPKVEYFFTYWLVVGGRTLLVYPIEAPPSTEVLWFIYTAGPLLEMLFYMLFVPIWKHVGRDEFCIWVIPMHVGAFVYLIYESCMPLGGMLIMPMSTFIWVQQVLAFGVALVVWVILRYRYPEIMLERLDS